MLETAKNDASTWLRRFLLCLHFVFIVSGCTIPQAPGKLEWDLKITAPFGVETYRLIDLVESDSIIDEQGWGIGMGADSILVFTARGELDSGFEDSLRLDPFTYQITKFIDAIFLPIEQTQERESPLSILNPDVAMLHGQTIVLDPYPLYDQQPFALPDGVDSLRVDTGHVWIHIENGLPDEVTQLEIRMDNMRGEEFLLVSEIDIAIAGSFSAAVPLNGMNLGAVNEFTLQATGAGGEQLIDSTRGITWSVEWRTLQCEPYYGIVYPQFLRQDSTFDLDQQHRLYNGTVKRGTLELIASNVTQFDDSIFVKFPDAVDPGGDTLQITDFVLSGRSDTITIDLTNYRLRLYNEFPQKIRVEMRSISIQTSDHRIFDNDVEIVSGLFSVRDLTLSYFEGELATLRTDIPYDEIIVERPPKGWDAVHPTTVDIALHIQSSVALYADIQLYLTSYLSSVVIDTVNIFLRDVYFGNDSTIWIRDVAQLVADYPDRFSYEGNALINGVVATSDTGHIRADVELIAPLRFRMDTVNAPGEVTIVDIEPIEDIESANAIIKIWNRLPLGGETIVLISGDSSALAPGSNQLVDTAAVITIPIPPLENGRAASLTYSEFTIPLNNSLIELLRHPPFYARVSILLPGNGEQEFLAHAADFVQVQVVGEIVYRVNSEDGP